MIILELHKRDWNAKYFQYNPERWVVGIEPVGHGLGINAMTKDVSEKRSYGAFDNISIRTTPIPSYVPKSDIETWD